MDEIEEADEWYRARDEKAAANWRAAAKAKIESIATTPKLWAADAQGFREVSVDQYPYKIVYRIVSGIVEIVAVAHASRRRGYWKRRLRKR